jgi:nucleoside-diphosphate-sugar epimerase
MKNVIIIGSTGMIGNTILKLCLENKEIGKITLINRKPIDIKNSKVTEIIHTDFMNFESVKNQFTNQDICFYCLGVYTGQVPTQEFNKITIDYTKAFVNALKQVSPQSIVCFLSGQGADSSEKSSVLFAKAKGIAENYILSLKFPHTYIFRPGYIYPVEPRKEPNLLYQIFRVLYKPLSFIYPNIGLTSLQLAQKMLSVGLLGNNKVVLENSDIRHS